MNVANEDFNKCVNDYINRQNEFHEKTLRLNAWLRCQRMHELKNGKRNVELSDFKVAKFFSKITLDELKEKEVIDEGILQKIFPESITVSEEDMNQSIGVLISCDKQKVFRGKFELEFLKKIINDLKQKNKEGQYIKEHRECVKIDPNVDTLSLLSQFAETPSCLKSFLYQYKEVI